MAINSIKNIKIMIVSLNSGMELISDAIKSLSPLINPIVRNGLRTLILLKKDKLIKLFKNIDKYPVTMIIKSKIFQKSLK